MPSLGNLDCDAEQDLTSCAEICNGWRESCESYLQGLLQHNIELNAGAIEQAGGQATAFPLVWGKTDCKSLPYQWRAADFVVAADVIYDRDLMGPLLEVVQAVGENQAFPIT